MNIKSTNKWLFVCASMALLLTGCATPKIDANKFIRPKVVAIADIPDIRPAATIRVVVANWPRPYFSGEFDNYFIKPEEVASVELMPYANVTDSQTIRNQLGPQGAPAGWSGAATIGLVGGITAGIIEESAARTESRALGFPALVNATLETDLRTKFLNSLTSELIAKGIEVKILTDTRSTPPRMRWVAKDDKGESLAVGQLFDDSTIDADIFANISIVAIYAAPGPLNSYAQVVGVCIALYDARTRKFIGWQAFPYKPPNSKFEYLTYDALVSDVKAAGPALQGALISLVPQVASAISGQP